MSFSFPLPVTETTLAFIVAVLVFAGLVKGLIAMGMPTVGVGLLCLVMPPAQAAALIVVPAAISNVVQLATGPRLGHTLRRFWAMIVTVVIGTFLGGLVLGGLESHLAPGILGLTLTVYGVMGLLNLHLKTPPALERWLSPVAGFASGLLTGTTGVTVMPMAPYLQSLDMPKEELVQALGLGFAVSTFALGFALMGQGAPFSDPTMMLASLAALVPAVAGMEIGRRLRLKVSPTGFRRCFFAGLALLGLHMLARAILI
ncbi:sulfite exporter TauE/SafE family protein [Aquabacter sp. P-9]|uniref:sulfite exporter TauE/SafE family protein n=1 Tax=Aquabacter sediminis TaxID=3029197 RepID=UPI00237E2B58|nr:sulfite exporter TauE/SafE family protein [Aquabacter sp. P-9]MDE1571129.1 sulfite exporter TauE/SafE family protein [Aquabacter sp. P-9]